MPEQDHEDQSRLYSKGHIRATDKASVFQEKINWQKSNT